MKKAFRLVLAALFVLSAGLCVPGMARAADADFSFSYTISPETLGYKGGVCTLTLTVKNEHASKIIKSFMVMIEPNTVFTHTWNTSIAPGASQTISCNIPFEESDLNKELTMMVSIENDTDANPDGLKFSKFEIRGAHEILHLMTRVTPESDEYRPGETIAVRFTLKNIIDGISATNVIAKIHMNHHDSASANIIYEHEPVEYGTMHPGDEKEFSFSYTVKPEDAEQLLTFYEIEFDMMGYHYTRGIGGTFPVKPYDIIFTTHLSGSPVTVAPGGTVNFHVTVTNTGTEMINGFEARTAGGAVLDSAGSLNPGESGTFSFHRTVNESGNYHFTVVGTTGNQSKSVTTNNVHIDVAEPATPSPEPTPSPTPEATPSPDPTPSPTMAPTPEPDVSPGPTPASTESPALSAPVIAQPEPSPQATGTAQPGAPVLVVPLWLLVAVLAALLLVAVALVVIIAIRRIRKGKV